MVAPLVIILGVVLGVVTLVEVAVLANLYVLAISLFVYRSSLKEIFPPSPRRRSSPPPS